MWTTVKEWLFHAVMKKGAVSATTAAVAYLATPKIVEQLAAIGITIDQAKFTSWAVILVAGLVGSAWHWLDLLIKSKSGSTPS